jgi:hypothetical protein
MRGPTRHRELLRFEVVCNEGCEGGVPLLGAGRFGLADREGESHLAVLGAQVVVELDEAAKRALGSPVRQVVADLGRDRGGIIAERRDATGSGEHAGRGSPE